MYACTAIRRLRCSTDAERAQYLVVTRREAGVEVWLPVVPSVDSFVRISSVEGVVILYRRCGSERVEQ